MASAFSPEALSANHLSQVAMGCVFLEHLLLSSTPVSSVLWNSEHPHPHPTPVLGQSYISLPQVSPQTYSST